MKYRNHDERDSDQTIGRMRRASALFAVAVLATACAGDPISEHAAAVVGEDPVEASAAAFTEAVPDADGQALVVGIEWRGDALPATATVYLRDAEGTALETVPVTPAAGEATAVSVPFDLEARTAESWNYRLVVEAGGEPIGATGLDAVLDCDTDESDPGDNCTFAFEVNPEVSNALSISAELEPVLTGVIEQTGDGSTSLTDVITASDPALRSEALRFSRRLFRLKSGTDCICSWAQNGSNAYKLPWSPTSLYSSPTGQTKTYGTYGAGAVITARSYHKGTRWTGKRDVSTGTVQGETERRVWLNCIGVTQWGIQMIPIDYNNDGLVDWWVEIEVPLAWGPCDAPCNGNVTALALGVTDAYARSRRYGTSTSKAWGDGWQTYRFNGSQKFSIHSTAYASGKQTVSPATKVAIVQNSAPAPVIVEFVGKIYTRAKGRARDLDDGRGSTSYGYALYGQASCATNDPLVTYESASHTGKHGWICANIKSFYQGYGKNVSCP